MVRITMEDGGIIDIELNEEAAPITCENFKKLVSEGFYNGLTFHRVIPGFMIQGGCPLGNGTGGPGWNIKGEFAANGVNNPLKHTRGVISMARAMNPNSAGSQFFIMHQDAPHLDGQYAAFGKVVDVYDLPISQNLLVLPGTKLDQIKSVYSHQQAIAQSETFLRQFGLPATAMANTAMAAKFVAESGDSSKAAIASVETAALYGLEVLVPSINTDGDNTTRFIVLSREKPTGGNRFSLLFTVDNKPGKLGEVIQIIGASGFNMESIKSRPMPHVPFEYYFYVELVGDPTADETAALLRELDRTCRTVRLLGVYTK